MRLGVFARTIGFVAPLVIVAPVMGQELAPATDWSGIYVGAVATGAMVSSSGLAEYEYGLAGAEASGALGGTIGYNFQQGNFVYGVEADWSSGLSVEAETYDSTYLRGEADWKWLATLRARAGIATGNALFYGTAGLAFADAELSGCYYDNCTPFYYTYRHDGTLTGLAAGFGMEYALGSQWSMKADYLFVGFPSKYAEGDLAYYGADLSTSAHMLRLGLNYRIGGAGMASAPEAVPAESHDWSGFYVGAVGSFGLVEGAGGGVSSGVTGWDSAAAAGGTLGYNLQSGAFVYGVETDLSGGDINGVSDFYTTAYYRNTVDWNWYSTIRARAGVATGNALFYGTAGVAIADVDQRMCTYDDCSLSFDRSVSGTRVGYAAGVGVEYAFAPRVSLKAEYLYLGFPSKYVSDVTSSQAEFGTSAHFIRTGLNVALGGGQRTEAADLHDWSGLYVGAFGTGSLNAFDGQGSYMSTPAVDAGWAAGGTLGFNVQNGNFVYGVEADLQGGDLAVSADWYYAGANSSDLDWNWLGTVRARAGIATGNALFYGTAGAAIADKDFRYCYEVTCGPGSYNILSSGVDWGYAVGLGVEYALNDKLSLKAEYQHVGFESEQSNDNFNYYYNNLTMSADLFKVGLNWKLY